MPLRARPNEKSEYYNGSGSHLQLSDNEERKVEYSKQQHENINKQDITMPQLKNQEQMSPLSTFEQTINMPVANYDKLAQKKKIKILEKFLFSPIKNILLQKLLPQTMSMITNFSKLNVTDMLILVKDSSILKEIIPKIVESVESGDDFDVKTYIQSITAGDADEANQQKTETVKSQRKVKINRKVESGLFKMRFYFSVLCIQLSF